MESNVSEENIRSSSRLKSVSSGISVVKRKVTRLVVVRPKERV
jgi:hypothetical protein